MFWVAARCRSSTTARTSRPTCARQCGSVPSIPSSWTSSSRMPSRWTWTPSPIPSAWWWAASWSTSRRRASTRATPRARCRPTLWATIRSSGSRRTHARELGVIGLLNIQFAIKNETVYVLEVNPRASRTVPFVSKAIGVPLAKLATKVMLGSRLADLGLAAEREVGHIAVKEAVFPFTKFPGVDVLLGPEMKSTGEVMGIDRDFRKAYVKSQLAASSPLPTSGKVFLSVKNRDKRAVLQVAKRLADMGFSLVATAGTSKLLTRQGMTVELVHKVAEKLRPNIVDLM